MRRRPRGGAIAEPRHGPMDHVRANDLVPRSVVLREQPDRDGPLHAAVRELRVDERGHGCVGYETPVTDRGTEVVILENDLDGLLELFAGRQRLVARLLDLDRVRVVEAPGGQDYPVVVVVVDRRAVAIRRRRLVGFAPPRGLDELNREQPAPLPVQTLPDRRVLERGPPPFFDGVGAPAEPLDVYPHVVTFVLAHYSLTPCRCPASRLPLLLEDDRDPEQVEVLAGPAGALLERFHDPEALVRPAVELEVRLELADHAVATALRRAFSYHRPVVVPYPQGDDALESGPVAGDMGRVPHHVAGCRVVDLHQLSKCNVPP